MGENTKMNIEELIKLEEESFTNVKCAMYSMFLTSFMVNIRKNEGERRKFAIGEDTIKESAAELCSYEDIPLISPGAQKRLRKKFIKYGADKLKEDCRIAHKHIKEFYPSLIDVMDDSRDLEEANEIIETLLTRLDLEHKLYILSEKEMDIEDMMEAAALMTLRDIMSGREDDEEE